MKPQIRSLLAAALFALPSFASTETNKSVLNVAKAKTEVEFLAVGYPSALKIHGRSKEEDDQKSITGNLTIENGNVSGKVNVQIASFDTGIAMRNKHMKEKYLESEKFPQSEFALTEMKVPATADITAKAVPFKGNLTLHGVTKPVTGSADVVKKGKDLTLKFEFKLSTDDYNISTPSFMGITMAKDVTVDVNFEGSVGL